MAHQAPGVGKLLRDHRSILSSTRDQSILGHTHVTGGRVHRDGASDESIMLKVPPRPILVFIHDGECCGQAAVKRSVSVEQVARVGYWQDPVLVLRADPQTIWPPRVPFS